MIVLDITVQQEKSVLTVFLKGELDHHTASKIKDTIDLLMLESSVKMLILDMSEVTFMDSSGIGMIAGRYRRVKSLGGSMSIRNANKVISKVLKMSGINQLMKIS